MKFHYEKISTRDLLPGDLFIFDSGAPGHEPPEFEEDEYVLYQSGINLRWLGRDPDKSDVTVYRLTLEN